jgi:hypothetical protein
VSEQNETKVVRFEKNDDLDQVLAQTILMRPAITDRQMAEELGLSRQAVNKRRNSKKVQSIIRAELQTSADEIQLLRKKSIRHLSLLMDHPDPRISLSAARAVFTVCGVAEEAGYGEKAIRQSAVFTTSWGSGRG